MSWRKGEEAVMVAGGRTTPCPDRAEEELARTGSRRRFFKIKDGHFWHREEPA
jgi:hypothetical protein